jgi:hypothetical protein
MMRGMVIDESDKQLLTLAQPQVFLNGIVAAGFSVAADERDDFNTRTGCCFGHRCLRRAEKAAVLRAFSSGQDETARQPRRGID